MDPHRFLAVDLGAESGRAVVGTLGDGRLSLEEIYRFPNEPAEILDTLHWDVLALHNSILRGLRECAGRYGDSLEGVGIDTWGVDFGLLSRKGELLQNPVHYRDRRTEGMLEEASSRITPDELFRRTGMTHLPINTSLQLLSLRVNQNPALDHASTLLMMPDLLAYFLTGRKCCERTIAITTQLYDPWERRWSEEVIGKLDLPLSLFPELVDPGTILGELLGAVGEKVGLKRGVVITPCTHDTASAVAAVPAHGGDWAFLSCGTWSVVGALTPEVVISPQAFAAGVFNELTLESHFLCRNIMGLWLLGQARAIWEREGESYSYDELGKLAAQAPEGGPVINPDAPRFLPPQEMPRSIGNYCVQTKQRIPRGAGRNDALHPGQSGVCVSATAGAACCDAGPDFSGSPPGWRWIKELAAVPVDGQCHGTACSGRPLGSCGGWKCNGASVGQGLRFYADRNPRSGSSFHKARGV